MAKNTNSLIGINATKIAEIQGVIKEYIKSVNEVLKQMEEVKETNAFKGEYKEAVKNYIKAVRQTCFNVVSQLLGFNDKLDLVSTAFKTRSTSLAAGIETAAKTLLGKENGEGQKTNGATSPSQAGAQTSNKGRTESETSKKANSNTSSKEEQTTTDNSKKTSTPSTQDTTPKKVETTTNSSESQSKKSTTSTTQTKTTEKVESQKANPTTSSNTTEDKKTSSVPSNVNLNKYKGSVHSKSIASDSCKATAGKITSDNQRYSIVADSEYTGAKNTMSQTDYNLLVAQVAGESAMNYDDMLGVTTVAFNNLEAGTNGSKSMKRVLETCYWPWGKTYKNYMPGGSYYKTDWGQEKLAMATEVVNDALNGTRNLNSNVIMYAGNGTNNYFSDR